MLTHKSLGRAEERSKSHPLRGKPRFVRRLALATTSLLALSLTLVGACSSSDTESSPAAPSAGAGGAGGAGGEAGEAGQAGTPVTGKGNPSDFPAASACPQTCADACAKLDACGGADSEDFPLGSPDCLARCSLAEKGPMWGDISSHFKCCTAQPSCDAVRSCGGWLKDTSTSAACKKMCSCFFGGMGISAAQAAGGAPKGYVFAERALAVQKRNSSALALPDAVTERPFGRFTMLTAARELTDGEATSLAKDVETLPTFRDARGGLAVATGRVFIRAETPARRAAAEKLTRPFTVRSLSKLGWSRGLHVLEHDDAWAAVRAVEALQGAGFEAELDLVREYRTRFAPNDPKYPDQWHLHNTGQKGTAAGVDVRADEAWDITRGSPDVIVAIHDDGVDLDHPDLAPNLAPISPINWPDDWQALRDKGQFGGHGTSCAGVAAAKGDNGIGVSGACPDCRILPALLGLSTAGGAFQVSDADIAQHFKDITDAGAAVISNSWGIQTGDARFADSSFPSPDIAMVTADALDYAETKGRGGKGTVVLFAAGNDNSPLDSTAAYKTVIAVGAVDDGGLKAYYSNHGPELDIAAPSSGGLAGITTTSIPYGGNGGTTDNFGGTSSACPLVAGVVGLMLSANPALTAKDVRDILQKTATKIDPAQGAYDASGMSEVYGAGLVNAYTAVAMSKGLCKTPAECQAPSDTCNGCKKAACEPCRTSAECAEGACQAVAALGRSVCVPKAASGVCPTDHTLVGDRCLPSRAACGLCEGAEAVCNGQDDDCNGAVDDGAGACQGNGYCPAGSSDCGAGRVCAGVGCAKQCNNDADCGGDIDCKAVKDRYGASDKSKKACAESSVAGCKMGCEVLAASLPQDQTDAFVECMKSGKASCGAVHSCVAMLPIKF